MQTSNLFSTRVFEAVSNAGPPRFQWGSSTVPISPARFESDLRRELVGFQSQFPDSNAEADSRMVDTAVAFYNAFYAHLLTLPMPDTPPQEFTDWWNGERADAIKAQGAS